MKPFKHAVQAAILDLETVMDMPNGKMALSWLESARCGIDEAIGAIEDEEDESDPKP